MAITISTGDLKKEYEIVETIFAIDSHQGGFFKMADPSSAFEGVKRQLRNTCEEIGADAVICCQFEYRNAVADGFMGSKQVIEIFAYGTAIKFKT